MKKVQTYTPPIDEQGNQTLLSVFTNWAGDESTGNLPVSGKAIRELLLSRLQKPFELRHDETGKVYRIFRDASDYATWLTRDQYEQGTSERKAIDALSLFEFVAPSPYSIKLTLYGSNVDAFDNSSRYVRSGVSNDSTKLKFRWDILQDEESYPDTMLVTYKIQNTSERREIKRYGLNEKDVTFDLFDYLVPGTNTITMEFLGESCKALKSIGFTIDVIVLKLSSEFPYNKSFSTNDSCLFKINLDSTGNTTKKIWVYLDDSEKENLLGENISVSSSETNFVDTVTKTFRLLAPGYHTLQLQATTTVNDETFCSNLLYYQFVVPEDVSNRIDYIVTKYSFDNVVTQGNISNYQLYADQYKPFSLDWAYTTNSPNAAKLDVVWNLIQVDKSNNNQQKGLDYTFAETQKGLPQLLEMIPDIATTDDYDCVLRATVGSFHYDYPIVVEPSQYKVTETGGYVLKLSAVGKQNTDPTWTYTTKDQNDNDVTYSTTFTNFTWDTKSGWNNSALLVAEHSYATINFAPFAERNKPIRSFGRTVEIEFEFSSIGDSSESLIEIGDCTTGFGIKITPNSASFVYRGSEKLTTNYKENERIKLAFIMQPTSAIKPEDNDLLWIVNNGILERCTSSETIETPTNNGQIKIGSATSKSKTAVYSIRCYDNAISYDLAFNNFAFDNSKTNSILLKNDVFNSSNVLDYNLVKTKIDTILITGQLDLIINMAGGTGDIRKQVQIPVTVLRICLDDENYNFIIKNCRIRAHGQSTLNLPIPSFKIWSNSTFNCSTQGTTPNIGVPESERIVTGKEYTPVMYKGSDPARDCIEANEIYQGRYSFKPGAIPAKKWVLLANYADSSCTHNGGIQRLIQNTWYNAKVDNEYVLRSAPQQFATDTGAYKSTGWSHYVDNTEFPYEIRNSADSLPCVVFWKRTEESDPVFIGQYVLMDDKKSNFVYGERSIYNVPKDPFCLLQGNSDKDNDDNRIWDNTNVLRLEQTSANTNFASFLSLEEIKDVDGQATTIQFDGMVGDTYNWEEDFELIYPEKEDITSRVNGVKVFDRNKFINKVQPFINFYKWLVATRNSYNVQTAWWNAGVYNSAQEAFEATAADHLDLYKIAAYYIFLLRFGLVDSLERNAQLKTYDGQHWYYEPWDMDIALGNNNQGQITFNPPIDRNTRWGNAYAYTGRSTETSNWLYDALEAWQTTSNVVNGNVEYTPGFLGTNSYVQKTAAALFDAGLDYQKSVEMLDKNYSEKWCERLYNYSGHYKYIEKGSSDYYTWLQGARTTHRHWWLKTSFDYWDAEWGVGQFLRNSIYVATDALAGKQIKMSPATETYLAAAIEYTSSIQDKQKLQKDVVGTFTMRRASTTKKPIYILGASSLKTLDISEVMADAVLFNLSGCYDGDIGSSNLKYLNIGIPTTSMESGIYNVRKFTMSVNDVDSIDPETGQILDNDDQGLGVIADVLKEVESFNMQGHTGPNTEQNVSKWLGAMENLKEFRAIGADFPIFPGIARRTTYDVLQLPDSVTSITLKDASWTFADPSDSDPTTSTGLSIWTKNINDEFEQVGTSYYASKLATIKMPGNTGRNRCSYDFVKKIINAYKSTYSNDPNSPTYYRKKLNDVNLEIENIEWSEDGGLSSNEYLTYEDLLDLGSFNGGGNHNYTDAPSSFAGNCKLQGYIVMANENADDETLTSQFTELQTIFGTSIFSKSEGDLVIDYEQNTVVLTVGKPDNYPDGLYLYITALQSNWKPFISDQSNSDYYLVHEGYLSNNRPYRFPVSATKFKLQPSPSTATWELYRKSDNGNSWTKIENEWHGIKLVNSGNQQFVEIPELTNVLANDITDPQDFKIKVTIESEEKSAYIRVVPKSYPTLGLSCYKNVGLLETELSYDKQFNITLYDNTTYEIRRMLTYADNNNKATMDPNWSPSLQWTLTKGNTCPLQIESVTDQYVRLKLSRALKNMESFTATITCTVKFMSSQDAIISETRTLSMEIFSCEDSNAETMLKMAYAQVKSISDHNDVVLTKNQLKDLDIMLTPYNAGLYASAKGLAATYSQIVHFPESRFLKTNPAIATMDSNTQYANGYYTQGTLKSFIFPLESDSSSDPTSGWPGKDIGRSCFIGANVFVRCKYVDYGDRSQWNKSNDLSDSNRKQVMVFWQVPSYLVPQGNPPQADNLILVPSKKAAYVWKSLGKNVPTESNWAYFPVSLKSRIYVFNVEDSEIYRTADKQYELWLKFYNAYTDGENITDTVRFNNAVSALLSQLTNIEDYITANYPNLLSSE